MTSIRVLAGLALAVSRLAASAQIDLIGGHVQFMFDTAVAAMPHANAGRTRALAMTTKNRSALPPDLPSLDETA